jgi:hypothetical protein
MIETLSHPAQSAEFLSRLHDRELSPAEADAFESHRQECAECRAAVAEFEQALAAYRSVPVAPHASDLSARILRKIRKTSPPRRPFGVMFGIDVRWAGAFVAALLVVIIGAPVFSRRKPAIVPAPPASPLASAIPAYVLDAEELRQTKAESDATAERAPAPAEKRAAAKAERQASRQAAGAKEKAATDDLAAAAPSAPATSEGVGERRNDRDEIAAANADKADQRDAPDLFAANPSSEPPPAPAAAAAAAEAEPKRLAKSTVAQAQEPPATLAVRPADGEGDAPEVVRAPSGENLAALRGREYTLVVDSGGHVVSVEESAAAQKSEKDQAREGQAQGAVRERASGESVLSELIFAPGTRSRRLIVSVR